MDFNSFHILDDKTKEEYILKNGILLMTRAEPKFYIYLYALNGFYAEVYYHLQSLSVLYIQNFTSTERLKPYLSKIDISMLLAVE